MSDMLKARPFPRGALFGAAALIGFALITAATARITGIGATSVPEAAPVESYELRFVDRADGAVAVHRAGDERPVEVLAPGTNGFVRGAVRGLARERKLRGIGPAPPFRLIRWADGRLSLKDPSTGREIHVEAFGPTQVEAFVAILEAARDAS